MRTVSRGEFKGTNDELRAQIQQRVDVFHEALVRHATTEGVPAPREDDLIEHLARSGEPFEIEPEPAKSEPLTPEQLAAIELADKRENALRALDEARLEAAMADPNAPQEVKDYAAARTAPAAR